MELTKYLKTLQYPGRFIVIGKSGGALFGVYSAMGRSAASLARIYKVDEKGDIVAVASDGTVSNEGDPELLEYRSLKWFDDGFVIANGRQIELVKNPGFLQNELMTAEPEPDKYLTPRITGIVSGTEAALCIARSVNGVVERKLWPLGMADGKGYFISTYTGADVRPTPSFAGDPVEVEFNFDSPDTLAHAVFDALAPAPPQDDYRVGVFGVKYASPSGKDSVIVNRLKKT